MDVVRSVPAAGFDLAYVEPVPHGCNPYLLVVVLRASDYWG